MYPSSITAMHSLVICGGMRGTYSTDILVLRQSTRAHGIRPTSAFKCDPSDLLLKEEEEEGRSNIPCRHAIKSYCTLFLVELLPYGTVYGTVRIIAPPSSQGLPQ
jgi:hypothetical protein